jgi:hypothetical protein
MKTIGLGFYRNLAEKKPNLTIKQKKNEEHFVKLIEDAVELSDYNE